MHSRHRKAGCTTIYCYEGKLISVPSHDFVPRDYIAYAVTVLDNRTFGKWILEADRNRHYARWYGLPEPKGGMQ